MSWTKEQLAAMQKGSGNLLVAAGAGSGKTAVLIERVLGIICDEKEPVDVDNLLIVTFTNAAAAEMRGRMIKALREKREQEPENQLIARQLVLMQRAHIMTIHAFCKELLKEHGYLLGLDAKSKIGSEGELALLRERVMDEVFEAAYAEENSGLKLLLRHYSRSIGDESLRGLVLKLLQFAQSMPDIEEWLLGLAAVYTEKKVDVWLEYFGECVRDDIGDLAVQAAAAAFSAEAVPKYLPILQGEALELAQIAKAAETEELPELLARLEVLEFKRLPSVLAKDEVDPADKKRVQGMRSGVKDGVAELVGNLRAVVGGAVYDDLAELAPMAEALVKLTLQFYRAWQQAKRRARLWEFADLEHYALELLQSEELGVAKGLKERFYEVLVDEYQDVNRVQETLLAAIARDDNRFMVGDIKQSIYRFRLAEPGLFGEKFAAFGDGVGGKRIDLNRNFRSQPWVLDGVNFIFSRLMQGGNTEIVYDESAMLYPGRDDMPKYPTELLLIDKGALREQAESADDEAAVAIAEMKNAELEGRLLADRILAERAAGRKWGDMVILLRAVKSAAPAIAKALSERGIPCVTDSGENFISLPEVQTVINLLSVVDNPRQDIPLAALLHSPLVGLSPAELADLRLLGGKGALYDGVLLSYRTEVVAFLHNLHEWRQKSREMGMAELLEYIYNRTSLPELMGALVGGNLRRRNLAEVKRFAAEYDESGSLGISRFLRFLQAAGRKQQAADKQQTPDAVRLMTIHKSKGLEFPVVFVAGLGSKLNEDDFKQDILLHRTLGLGMRRVDLAGRRKYMTFGYNIIMRKTRWENIAEALRILYVALTRAEEKLVLIGTDNLSSLAAKLAVVGANVPPSFLVANRSFLPMICAALLPHPDAALLRTLVGGGQQVNRDIPGAAGPWHIEIIKELGSGREDLQAARFGLDEWLAAAPCGDTAQIDKALARSYPGAELGSLPVKWSATALDNLKPEVADEEEVPKLEIAPDDFAEDMAENPREDRQASRSLDWYAKRGSLVHKLLEKADLSAILGGTSPDRVFAEQLAALAESYPSDVVSDVDTAALVRFFASDVGLALLAAKGADKPILREQRFAARLTVGELCKLSPVAWQKLALATGLDLTTAAKEPLFFQGVIDLAFWDESQGGWILVDYKTGGNRTLADSDVVNKYAWQLSLYRHALTKALGQSVVGGYVFFTANARTVKIF